MSLTVISYLIYLPISIAVTMLVGHTLFKNGRVFLIDIFAKNERLADSINKLLLMGFYLINIGYVTLNLSNGQSILNLEHLIEKLSYKFGILLLVLGAIHFLNLLVLYKIRKSNEEDQEIARLHVNR